MADTPNYNLFKFEDNSNADLRFTNPNMDKIDAELKKNADAIANVPKTTVLDSTTNGNIVVNGAEIQVFDDTTVNQAIASNSGAIQSNTNNIQNLSQSVATKITNPNGDGSKVINDKGEAMDIPEPSNLVKKVTIQSGVSSVTIDDLDINADGGVYDIVVKGFSSASATQIFMTINNATTGYRYANVNTSSGTNQTAISLGINQGDFFIPMTLVLANNKPMVDYIQGSISSTSGLNTSHQIGALVTPQTNITELEFTGTFTSGTIEIRKRG